MKKLLFVLLAALVVMSCQKKEEETNPVMQDVSFTAIEITPDGGLKSSAAIECIDNTPTNAHFVIGQTEYDPALFELDGVLYTQAIKLPVQAADYCVTEFFLYDDVDGSGTYNTGDKIVYATPDDDSPYGAYVTDGIDYCFGVESFTKAQLPIEVLCFQEAEYTDFGFDWFLVTEIVVRQQCFFGDICVTYVPTFANEPYYSLGGVQPDEEAVIRVIVKVDDVEVPYSPFDNKEIYGTGKPLCVEYPDILGLDETFTFELQVWVPTVYPDIFAWQTYAIYTLTQDDGMLVEAGNDGVVDFAIGDCSPDSYPIYEWLPAPVETDAFGFRIKGSSGPDTYLGVDGLGIKGNRVEADAGNPLANGTYPVIFTFDNTTNLITLSFAGKNLSMQMDDYTLPCTGYNGFTIMVRDSRIDGALEWQNVKFNGNPMPVPSTYNVMGTPGWMKTVFAGDFSGSFTVTADLVVYGLLNAANENLKAEMHVVCF